MIKRHIQRFWTHQRGATAVEYAILVGLLSLVVVGAASGLSNQLYGILGRATNAINH